MLYIAVPSLTTVDVKWLTVYCCRQTTFY